jgi:hypothetical protein
MSDSGNMIGKGGWKAYYAKQDKAEAEKKKREAFTKVYNRTEAGAMRVSKALPSGRQITRSATGFLRPSRRNISLLLR